MDESKVIKIALNFFAALLLITFIATPFYFARNFTKIAGVKTESSYLIVPQIEKFPGMKLIQEGDDYQISFTKQAESQAYFGVLILNNPTGETKTYNLQISEGSTKVFFGEDLDNLVTRINVPTEASVPVSLLSKGNASLTQIAEFTIDTE